MSVEINNMIMAVITTNLTLVSGGGAPVFKVNSAEEGQEMAVNLSSILNGMAHDVGNGVIVIVKH